MQPLRYRVVGGLAGWRVPVVCAPAVFVMVALGEWVLAWIAMGLGLLVSGVERTLVLEVGPGSLARGLVVGGRLVAPLAVVPWASVTEIATRARGVGSLAVLETHVISATAGTIRFSVVMGARGYRSLLAEVARRAPRARRTGLTDAVLAETQPAPPRAQSLP